MSRNQWLATFAVGERRYVETTPEKYRRDMAVYHQPACRRPKGMKPMKFSTSLYTAVPSGVASEIKYLICVERVE